MTVSILVCYNILGELNSTSMKIILMSFFLVESVIGNYLGFFFYAELMILSPARVTLGILSSF